MYDDDNNINKVIILFFIYTRQLCNAKFPLKI